MVTSTGVTQLLQPTNRAKIPIVLSEELQRTESSSKRSFASFLYNYKPILPSTQNPILKLFDSDANGYTLSTKAENSSKAYKFTGSQRSSDALALIYDPNAEHFILHKIDFEFKFNLTSTPEQSSKDLAGRYPQLETDIPESNSGDEDLFDEVESVSNDGPDPNNPYDYRHYLRGHKRRTPSPEPKVQRKTTPKPAPTQRRQSRTKTKSRPRPQPRPRTPSPAREEADADNEDSDDRGLTIEMEPSTQAAKPKGFRGALASMMSNAPISLRSAAASVSPRGNATPEHARTFVKEEVRHKKESSSPDNNSEVEELHLPSPFAAAPTPGEVGQDEDDDVDALEADIEQAMESQADELEAERGTVAMSQKRIEESSSSSEEE